MRRLLLLVLLAGCPEHGKRPDGGVRDTPFDPGIADAGSVCAPTGGCPSGPACDATCCNIGEQCIAGVCHCGTDFACTGGDTCQTGGPGGGGVCGTVCCGSAQHPCPL